MDLKEEAPNPDLEPNSVEERRRINQQRSEAALIWLKDKWKTSQACPICTQSNWSIGNILELRPFNEGDLILGGELFPIAPVCCLNCGYTFFISGIISKVIAIPEKKQDDGGVGK